MDHTIYSNQGNPMIGIPYDNIKWKDIPGQPFGLASQFNLFVLGSANNIVDVEGAVAIGDSFYSPRSLSIGFQRDKGQVPIEFSPDLVRYLVGNIVSVKGPLVVIGHVVAGGNAQVSLGSAYYIGKDNSNNQLEELKYLYRTSGGSPYWTPSDKENYYIISSYDVPRIIPVSRISANLSAFFNDARESLNTFKDCIVSLNSNGTVTSNSYEWVLSGNDPKQNVFTIDVRPNGLLNKGIRFQVPKDSIAIVRLKTGPHAHLQYGLYGEERMARQILYVFEDATNIHMEKSSDIWGSILAPQAMFHGHPTGGHVSGNAAFEGFAVNANSGFEFHLYPFAGGVSCMDNTPSPEDLSDVIETPILTPLPQFNIPIETPENPTSEPLPIQPICPKPIPCPEPEPCPTCPTCPEPIPCPACPTCPKPEPCPTCPEPEPCPTCPTCPEPEPCPACPTCPEPEPCPACPTCPEPEPCPACPTCPEPEPCPVCPECPKQETEYVAVPVPIPVPIPINIRQKQPVCPVCEECLIKDGVIEGCVIGCNCCRNHEWDVMLYEMLNGRKRLLYCISICHLGSFHFEVDCNGSYILKICPARRNCFVPACKPKINFKNIGVTDLTIE